MWRILSKREIESRKLQAKERNRAADERYLRAHGGSDGEAACRERFYKAYALQVAKGLIKARQRGGCSPVSSETAESSRSGWGKWRIGATLLFVAIGVTAVVEFAATDSGLGSAATRSQIPVIFGLGAAAALAVAISQGQRKAGRESRRHEIEPSSLDPLVVSVEDDEEADKVELASAGGSEGTRGD